MNIGLAFDAFGVPAHRIHMEVPHPALIKPKGMQRAVDIRAVGASGPVWVEVKFDRMSRNRSQLNETNRFGSLLRDFIRAGLVPGEGIVFYVTDAVMQQYIYV